MVGNYSKRILIYDFNDTGHCPGWLELSVRAVLKGGISPTVAAVFENQEVSRRIDSLTSDFHRIPILKKLTCSHFEAALEIAEREGIRRIFFPNLDSIIYDLGKRGKVSRRIRVNVAGIWLRPYLSSGLPGLGEVLTARLTRGADGKQKRRRVRTLRNNRKAIELLDKSIGLKQMTIFFTDSGEVESPCACLGGAALRLICDPWLLPPAGCSKNEARHRLDLPEDRIILLHVGTARAEKGLDTLCEAFSKLSGDSQNKMFVFRAGAVDWSAAGPLDALCKAGSAVALDRVLSDEELSLAYAAADWVLLPYRDQKESSGILVHAAAHSRPVIVSDHGLIGKWTSDYSLGLLFAHKNEKALLALLEGLPGLEHLSKEGMQAFASMHSPDQFMQTLLDSWLFARQAESF